MSNLTRTILITGADGFIGSNLLIRLKENESFRILKFVRTDNLEKLSKLVSKSDVIIHLAGENRPSDVINFTKVNIDLTKFICDEVKDSGRNIPIIYSSSTKATENNEYGKSKLAAESILEDYVSATKNTVTIYRLPGVFGKWSKPNYNSVVATFCFNIARGKDIHINNKADIINLVYIDDIITDFFDDLHKSKKGLSWGKVSKNYSISLGDLANQIFAFKNSRDNLITEQVGNGLTGALYSTYISFLPKDIFSYDLPSYGDDRGNFVEVLKTKNSGQFSFLTIKPGITRGSHYHHSKTEKFILVKGAVRLKFRHLITQEIHEINLSDESIQVVDTIPGWVHDITNVGNSDSIIMLWANENFDRENPDTIAQEV